MSRILLISNGHGEDLSGSLLAKSLITIGHTVHALPIVGHGHNYKNHNIKVLGKTKEFRTGGLGYNSLKGILYDLIDGQFFYFLRKLILTYKVRKKYDCFLLVGDIIPIAFSWIVRKKCFIYLVAYSSHYEGKLNLPFLCKFFLMSNKVKTIFSRDLLTAIDLSNQLGKKVNFYGNPFMDRIFKLKKEDNNVFSIACFPGSREPELINNFILMLEIIENLSNDNFLSQEEFSFALVKSLDKDKLIKILRHRKWIKGSDKNNKFCNAIFYQYRNIKVSFCWNVFDQILVQSDLVLSMSGTAAEQAVGLGKPVIQVEGKGPQFTKTFAEAQRRLLGKYIYCATQSDTKEQKIEETIKLILKLIYLIKFDPKFLINCKKNASKRLGGEKSCNKISKTIDLYLKNE